MEACEESSFSPAFFVDRRSSKQVYDNVHGNIYLDSLSLKFIDTEQFQRLRDLKQLGLVHMVYPGAVHSRFEHSLGVYWLAGEAVHTIKAYQGLELGMERFDMETVKLAGLLHDVGHGPFSHTFESALLPQILRGSKWSHEDMATRMVDYIVDEHNIDVDPGCLKKVKEMIVASEHFPHSNVEDKKFLYDIVANGRNGVDVDKFDYILRDTRACGLGCNFQFRRLMESMRVLGDEICYRAKDCEYYILTFFVAYFLLSCLYTICVMLSDLTIHKLFATRADLHRTVYSHAKVKAIELMLVDALTKADNFLKISSSVQEPAEFWKLDDSIVKRIEATVDQDVNESRDLIRRIRRRDLYRFCDEFSVPKGSLEHFKAITPQDIVCSQKSGGITLEEEDVAVSNVKIDLTRGRNNPLESVNFFEDYESEEKFRIQDDRISHMLPAFYQDMIVRVYSKKPEQVEAVSAAFRNFQLKTFGTNTQVHSTPETKKRRML